MINKTFLFFFQYTYRIWEGKHFNPAWIFETEIGSKVRSLIYISDHPINMSHLAKLFTSQLILSCSQDVRVNKKKKRKQISN